MMLISMSDVEAVKRCQLDLDLDHASLHRYPGGHKAALESEIEAGKLRLRRFISDNTLVDLDYLEITRDVWPTGNGQLHVHLHWSPPTDAPWEINGKLVSVPPDYPIMAYKQTGVSIFHADWTPPEAVVVKQTGYDTTRKCWLTNLSIDESQVS